MFLLEDIKRKSTWFTVVNHRWKNKSKENYLLINIKSITSFSNALFIIRVLRDCFSINFFGKQFYFTAI